MDVRREEGDEQHREGNSRRACGWAAESTRPPPTARRCTVIVKGPSARGTFADTIRSGGDNEFEQNHILRRHESPQGCISTPCLKRTLIRRTFCQFSSGLPSSARKLAS